MFHFLPKGVCEDDFLLSLCMGKWRHDIIGNTALELPAMNMVCIEPYKAFPPQLFSSAGKDAQPGLEDNSVIPQSEPRIPLEDWRTDFGFCSNESKPMPVSFL